ncbi:hypothetical protein BV22DRAFT_753683 [Leucogyrophana mollusca]|uniref:Uncharacterized protein n=1 Tax=Leucogyrophana mollusca TaxID=85980 RepID=A0ACB8B618_9AGAM|nr:hypothetical protein BV22DRAFT_753683 [Leucogyrophana mollusca]
MLNKVVLLALVGLAGLSDACAPPRAGKPEGWTLEFYSMTYCGYNDTAMPDIHPSHPPGYLHMPDGGWYKDSPCQVISKRLQHKIEAFVFFASDWYSLSLYRDSKCSKSHQVAPIFEKDPWACGRGSCTMTHDQTGGKLKEIQSFKIELMDRNPVYR